MPDYYDETEETEEAKMTKEEEFLVTGRSSSFSSSMLETIQMLEAKVNALEIAVKDPKQLEDGINGEEKNEEDEGGKFPADTYSMMALNGPSRWGSRKSIGFFAFGVGVWAFQIIFLTLVLYSQTAVKRGTVEESDNPSSGFFANLIPPNAQNVVIATQVFSLLAYVLFPESSVDDVVSACQLFPPLSAKDGGPLWNMRFASLMRGFQASCAVGVVWILVMTSGTPVDIILNFTAINFVSSLDDLAFELVEKGVFGPSLEEEAKRITDTNLPKCVQRTKIHVCYWIVMTCTGVSLFSFLIYALVSQSSNTHWLSETFRVEFTGTSFAKYSGCFNLQADSEKNFKRYSYKSNLTEVATTLGYCRDDRQWILFEGHDLKFDPCKANELGIGTEIARSADTDSFDVSSVFDERWTSGSGAPLDLFFFESTDADELNCGLVLGDGFCDEAFNDPGYEFDQGDCCATTCIGPNCLRGGMKTVFGISNDGMESFGFQDCKDDQMKPITFKLNAIKNSRDNKVYPGELCYDNFYIDEETWRNKEPTPTYYDLDCDGRPVMTVNIDKSMEGNSETVWVKDGADCTLFVRNSTASGDDYARCTAPPTWYVNSTLFHGEKGNEIIEIVTHHSEEVNTLNFTRLPDCYINELGDRLKIKFETSTVYTGDGPVNKAIDWLLEDSQQVVSCGDDGFGTRFNLAFLYFSTTPENEFINREKHCTWDSIICGPQGQIEMIDLHSSGLDGTLPLPNNVRDFPDLTHIEIYQNTITAIEADIGRFTTLKIIDMDDNLLSSIPSEIGNLENLEDLFFSFNNVSTIPTEIGLLTELKRFHSSNNPLESMPTEIGLLKKLYQFESYDSNLDYIPTEIGLMESLEELYLNGNVLESVPTEIGLLAKLERLHLESNQLVSIPTEIGLLTNLEELKLESNPIATLPTELSLLPKLKEIFLGGNDTVTCDDLPEGVEAICYD